MANRTQKITGNILFRETQQFRIKWLWIILVSCVFVSIGVTSATFLLARTDKVQAAIALGVLIPSETLMLYFFYIVKLETAVTSDGVFYRWRPLVSKYNFIAKAEIASIASDKGPSMSYGWHYIAGYGSVNNTGPGKGLQFVLTSGRKIFIGTQKINAFQSAVEEIAKVK